MTLWNDVRAFNRACGVRLRSAPGWVPDDEVQLALRLVDEERDELADALANRDMVEVADAIADSLYVLAGFLLRLGLARTYIDEFLPAAVMPPTWEWIDSTPAVSNLDAALQRLHEAVAARNLHLVDGAAHNAMFHLAELARALNIPLDKVWAEVQRSNMAKLVDGKVVRRTQDNKILKPEGWTAPDIAGVLAAHGWAEAA